MTGEGESGDCAKLLADGHHEELYARIMKDHGAEKSTRGAKVLRAALKLGDDGKPEP